MAKAYKCDLCGKYIGRAYSVGGLDFKIGEYRDEFTGIHNRKKEVHDVCRDCYEKIMHTVESLYSLNENLCEAKNER